MMIGVLFRNEMLKMVKRLAFWVTLIFFSGVTLIEHGASFVRAREDPTRSFALPEAWGEIITDDLEAALIFGAIVLILLVANEFTWRTARQNVIDGLSKTQLFVGKTMLIPLLAVIFVGVKITSGAFFAYLGTDRSAADALMTGMHWHAMAGACMAFLGWGSLAFAVSTAIRSGGPSMGVWLFYVAALEGLIGEVMLKISHRLETVVEFLPAHVFAQFGRYMQYDKVVFVSAVDRATAAGRTPPEIWDSATLWTSAIGWLVVLIGGSYLLFRKRDL
ncbi:MAG TPA: ABC transporter permease subunit [Gemmatimonadales bacterium]